MKKIILTLLFASSIFVSCEDIDTANVSKITNYPIIELNGEKVVVLNQGDTYTELGGTAMAGTEELELTIEGDEVDTSKPDVYVVEYSTVNVDGFKVTDSRDVIVLSTTPTTIDLSGTFFRNGNPNNVTKTSDPSNRVYICDNATGYITTGKEKDDNITLTFYNYDDLHVYAPYQENASVSGISAQSSIGNIISNDKWNWVIYASAVFGTAQRNFSR
jgi:hypothetical protein